MNELLNEQISLVLEDLTLITNPYERSLVRVNLINALSNLSPIDTDVEVCGKDAIKSDYAKSTQAKEEPVKQEVVEETKEEEVIQEQAQVEEIEKVEVEQEVEVMEPNEIDLDKSVCEHEPIIVAMEDEEGNEFEIDITEVYYNLSDELEQDERVELAQNITAYNLIPIYNELTNLKDSNNKMMLAYYLQQLGVEYINDFISNLTDGSFNLIHEFANDDNIEYIISELEAAFEDAE